MKVVLIALSCALMGATATSAGTPAVGKVCHYTPTPLKPDTGLAYGQYSCATSMYGEWVTDQGMGGVSRTSPGDVTVNDIARAPYIIPGCEGGREMQVNVSGPMFGRGTWIFPRFLDCPD